MRCVLFESSIKLNQMMAFSEWIFKISYIVILFVIYKIFTWLYNYYLNVSLINKIPGPKMFPLIGNAFMLKKNSGKLNLFFNQLGFIFKQTRQIKTNLAPDGSQRLHDGHMVPWRHGLQWSYRGQREPSEVIGGHAST